MRELGLTSAAVGLLLEAVVPPCLPAPVRTATAAPAPTPAPPRAGASASVPFTSAPQVHRAVERLVLVLKDLVPYLASPGCDRRVADRHLVQLAAGVVALTRSPMVAAIFDADGAGAGTRRAAGAGAGAGAGTAPGVTFDPFDTPASVFLKTCPGIARLPRHHVSAITVAFNELLELLPLSSRLRAFLALVTASPDAPLWFQSACGQRLSRFIMHDGGVEALLGMTVVPADDDHREAAAATVATLLTQVPVDIVSPDDYFAAVGPQLLAALTLGGTAGRALAFAAAVTLGCMLAADSTAIRARVVRPLVLPLLQYQRPDHAAAARADGGVVVAEAALVQCVERLHKVVTAVTPAAATMDALAHVMPALFDLYQFVVASKSHVTAACEEVIVSFFKLSSEPLPVLLELAVPGSYAATLRLKDPRWCLPGASGKPLRFAPGPSAGVQVVAGGAASGPGASNGVPSPATPGAGSAAALPSLSSVDAPPPQTAVAVVRLLRHPSLKNTDLPGGVLVALLERYMAWRRAGSQFKPDFAPAGAGAPADVAPSRASAVALLQVLMQLIADLGPNVFRNTAQALQCVKSVMATVVPAMDPQSPDAPHVAVDGEGGMEVLSVCLSLLSLPVDGGVPVRPEDEPLLRDFLPFLAVLQRHPLPEVSELAAVLRMSILARGGAGGDKGGDEGASDGKTDDGGEARVMEALATATAYLRDTHTPVQSGGLQLITELLKERHPALSSRVDDIMRLMVNQLHNTDTYVFLAAVAGIQALADGYAEAAVPQLAAALRDGTLPFGVRAKLGMAMSGAVRRCGRTFPKFAPRVVMALVVSARPLAPRQLAAATTMPAPDTVDDVMEFRAGCISCMADVMHVLDAVACRRFAPDVLDCCKGVLQFERRDGAAAMVRRAAGYVLVQVMGLMAQYDAMEDLSDALPGIKVVLEHAQSHDPDAITRTHARDALLTAQEAVGSLVAAAASGGSGGNVLHVGLRPHGEM